MKRNKLFENPNAIWVRSEGRNRAWSYKDCIAFSYDDRKTKMYVGNSTHVDLVDIYDEDSRGPCSGRLFLNEKVITFWRFPENYEELIKTLDDIVKEIKKAIFRYKLDPVPEIPNFNDKEWRIEIPKNHNASNWGKLTDDWDPTEDTQDFIKIEDYRGGIKRSDAELKMRHLMPPAAGKKEVPLGFGSRNPKYLKKRQWQMASMSDEGKKEELYPRLDESPDNIWINDERFDYDKANAVPFIYYEIPNKLFMGLKREGHVSLEDRIPSYKPRIDGRLFFDPQVITFWRIPTKEIIKKIVDKFSKKYKIELLHNNWKLEVYMPNYTAEKFIPLDDYLKDDTAEDKNSKKYSSWEEALSSLDKRKEVPLGFGSRNPKYLEHRKWQMANLASESFYPRLKS